MKIFCALFFLSILLCRAIFADCLTLAELIDIALKNNPETEKVWWHAKRACAALGAAKSDYYPKLGASGTFSHGREVKFPNGPNTIYTNYGADISLTYLLFDCGERSASVKAAKEALQAANWSSDFAIQRVIYKVAATYYEYLNAEELLKSKQCSLADADIISNAAIDLCNTGLRGAMDRNTSRAALAQAQMELAQQRAQVAIAYGKLMNALGLPIETKLEMQTDPQAINNAIFTEGISNLITLATQQRADLLAKQAYLAEVNALVMKESRAKLPKLRALGQGGWLEYTKHQGSGYNYLTGLSLDIPLFKGFEYIYRKRLAYAEAEITQSELKELQEAIALEVLTYSESVKAAQEALYWSDAYLCEATNSYAGALESYKSGLHNIFDLLQTQRYLADARIKKTQANTQWLVSLAELAFATGSTIQ